MKREEMKYVDKSISHLLASATRHGYQYFIVSKGTHPTAYIKLTDQDTSVNYSFINVHGGITYNEDYLYTDETGYIDGHFIGWDYIHSGDYFEFSGIIKAYFKKSHCGKKWKVKDILKHVDSVIEQLIETRNNNVDS